jgi:hypothetical protein
VTRTVLFAKRFMAILLELVVGGRGLLPVKELYDL